MKYIRFGNGEKNYVIIPGLSVHSVLGLRKAIEESHRIFTREYTVYLFDRPEMLGAGCTIREIAEETAEAMAVLNLQGADVFGASMGGMIAQYIAIDHPELVHRLILGSTSPKPGEIGRNVIGEWLDLAEAHREDGLLESIVDKVYSKNTLAAHRQALILGNRGIRPTEYQQFIVQAKACLNFDCSKELYRIQCPTLVLGSKGDRVLTDEGSRRLAKTLNCELYLYDESYGHGVYDEAPDYKSRCLEFLQKRD